MKRIKLLIIITIICLFIFQLFLVSCSCNVGNEKSADKTSKVENNTNTFSSVKKEEIYGTDENGNPVYVYMDDENDKSSGSKEKEATYQTNEQGIKIEDGDLPIMTVN